MSKRRQLGREDLGFLWQAAGLRRINEWLWRSACMRDVSYPADGHAAYFEIEDTSFWFEHRNRSILDLINIFPPPGVLLDVGGGNGVVTRHLVRNGVPAVLLEPGESGVANARARGLEPIIHSTLEGADFSSNTVPGVGLFDTLEHIADDEEALRLVSLVLVPGGRIYVTVPAFTWLWSAEDEHAGHFRRYSLSELTERLSHAGLSVEFATYLFSPLVLPVVLARTAASRLGWRSGGVIENARREHLLRQGAVAWIIRSSLRRERKRLLRLRPSRLGTSCLAVATKAS